MTNDCVHIKLSSGSIFLWQTWVQCFVTVRKYKITKANSQYRLFILLVVTLDVSLGFARFCVQHLFAYFWHEKVFGVHLMKQLLPLHAYQLRNCRRCGAHIIWVTFGWNLSFFSKWLLTAWQPSYFWGVYQRGQFWEASAATTTTTQQFPPGYFFPHWFAKFGIWCKKSLVGSVDVFMT